MTKFVIEVNLPDDTDPSEVLDRVIEETGDEEALVGYASTGPSRLVFAIGLSQQSLMALRRHIETRGAESLRYGLAFLADALADGKNVRIAIEEDQ